MGDWVEAIRENFSGNPKFNSSILQIDLEQIAILFHGLHDGQGQVVLDVRVSVDHGW